jgi:hypothetical protein
VNGEGHRTSPLVEIGCPDMRGDRVGGPDGHVVENTLRKPAQPGPQQHSAVRNLFTTEALRQFEGKLSSQAMHRVAMNAIATVERASLAIDEGRCTDLDAHALVSEHSPFAVFASDRAFREKAFLIRERWLDGLRPGTHPPELLALAREIQARLKLFRTSVEQAFGIDGAAMESTHDKH